MILFGERFYNSLGSNGRDFRPNGKEVYIVYFAIVEDQKSGRDHLISLIEEYCAQKRETITLSSY